MLIDHLVYAAPDLAAAVADLAERLGVRAQAGGKHIGLGTHNALLGLGATTYLEVVAADPEQPPSLSRPFGLDGLTHAGLAGWALACGDIDAAIAHARDHGYDPGDAIDMQRARSAGTVLRWRLTRNALDGGPVPFLIDWGDSEHPARSAPHGLILQSFEIEHPIPGPSRRCSPSSTPTSRSDKRRVPRSWPTSAVRTASRSCADGCQYQVGREPPLLHRSYEPSYN